VRVEPARRLAGETSVPGDKSISQRAVLLGAICEDETTIRGFGRSADTEATIRAVGALGVHVDEVDETTLVVHGVGLRGMRAQASAIDCANAGTLARLLAGILAAQRGQQFELIGDESLSTRPMGRIVEPLTRMGAGVESSGNATLPLRIRGADLKGVRYVLPVASAQVKSCVLLAGLYASGETTVVEPLATRDHTESLLEVAGADLSRSTQQVKVRPVGQLSIGEIEVPGDFSSAAPFIVAATLVPGSELWIRGVNLNPRRTGLLRILERMGADITVHDARQISGEPAGDILVRHASLVGTLVGGEEVPASIDELPLFALAAACAVGRSVLSGAAELRAKESDRIDAVVTGLRGIGAEIVATRDGFRVRGTPGGLGGGGMDSYGDHRIAMLAATAGLVSSDSVEIGGAGATAVSFPGFFDVLGVAVVR
jgi:3-phosphoshikimate 1-carboxyvinyltransferase